MKAVQLRAFIRSPSTIAALGLVLTLLVGSLAAAGMNTLLVSRLMISASCLIIIIFITQTSLTSNWSRGPKALTIFAVVAFHVTIERIETWSQPSMPQTHSIPVPPLLLMMPPSEVGYTYPEMDVLGIPLKVSSLARPYGGYAGFGKVTDNENDDVVLAIAGVQFRNMSSESLRLSWRLVVEGESKHIQLDGAGNGKWERQLNVNDFFAKQQVAKLPWLLSPTEIEPNGKSTIASTMGFVLPNADQSVRDIILRGKLPPEYTATLLIKDEGTGFIARLHLPFGISPVPAGDRVSRRSHEQAQGY